MARENVREARAASAKIQRQRVTGYRGEIEEVHDGSKVGVA